MQIASHLAEVPSEYGCPRSSCINRVCPNGSSLDHSGALAYVFMSANMIDVVHYKRAIGLWDTQFSYVRLCDPIHPKCIFPGLK